MAYQSLITGAQGILGWVYQMEGEEPRVDPDWHLVDFPSLWTSVGNLGAEIKDISSFVANGKNREILATNTSHVKASVLTDISDSTKQLLIILNISKSPTSYAVNIPNSLSRTSGGI